MDGMDDYIDYCVYLEHLTVLINCLDFVFFICLAYYIYWLMVKLFSTGSTNLFQEASILFQHIIPEVIVLFVELRPFSPHIYALFCRILSRQAFTRFL